MATDQYLEFDISGGERTETADGEAEVVDTILRSESGFPALKIFLNLTELSGSFPKVDFRVEGQVGGEFYLLKKFLFKTGPGKDLLVIQGAPRKVRLIWKLSPGTTSLTFSSVAFRTDDQFVPDFTLEASLSQIPGWEPVAVTGRDTIVDIMEFESIQNVDANWVPLATAQEMFISSSDATDAQLVNVIGLDEDFVEFNRIMTLSGQTPVSIGTLIRINRMVLISGDPNVGSVYASYDSTYTAGVPDDLTKVECFITPDRTLSSIARFTVPRGKIFILTSLRASVDSINQFVTIQNNLHIPGAPRLLGTEFHITAGMPSLLFPVPLGIVEFQGDLIPAIGETMTFFIDGKASSPNLSVTVTFEGWLVTTNQIR